MPEGPHSVKVNVVLDDNLTPKGDKPEEFVVQLTYTIKISPNQLLGLRERYCLDADVEEGFEHLVTMDELMEYNIQEWMASGNNLGDLTDEGTVTYTIEEWNQSLEEVVAEAVKIGKDLHVKGD